MQRGRRVALHSILRDLDASKIKWDSIMLQELTGVVDVSWHKESMALEKHRLFTNAFKPDDIAILPHRRHNHREAKVFPSDYALSVKFEVQSSKFRTVSVHWPEAWFHTEE